MTDPLDHAPSPARRAEPRTHAEPPSDTAAGAFDRLARVAARALHAPAAAICLAGPDGLIVTGHSNRPRPSGDAGRPLPFCRHIAASGRPLVIDDARGHPLAGSDPAAAGVGAYLGVPLPAGAGGVFAVTDTAPRGWTTADVAAVADLAAAAAADAGQRAELAAYRRGDERLRLLESVVVHANDAVLITAAEPVDGPDGPRVVYVNQAFTRMTGYAPEDILGKTPRILQSPGTDRAQLDKVRRALKRWRPVRVELENRHKDGTEFWVELSIVPVADATGWYTHWVSVQRDVTAAKRAERQLREGAARKRAVLDAALDCVITFDRAGRVVECNPAAERTFGRPGGPVVGRDVAELIPPPAAGPGRRPGLVEHLAAGGPVLGRRTELTAVRADGAAFPAEVAVAAVAVPGPPLYTAYLRDITAARRAAADLTQAKEAAEAANRAKSVFLSRMSHELRTPLNAVLGFNQLLELDDLSADQRENAGHIRKAGRHLLNLINEVLDISRVEAGDLTPSVEDVDLGLVVADALALVGPLAADAGVALAPPAGAGGRVVRADLQRLKQVLLNLLSNAVKYNRPGGRVAVTCGDAADGRVRVAVDDTGRGIPAGVLPRLFTPFDRLGAEGGPVEGTGLGLALSKRLVEAMGGAIGVDTAPGRGSRFWVDLPRARVTAGAAAAAGDAGGEAGPPAPTGGTVLYIEDNLSNVRLLERIVARRPAVRLVTAMQGGLGFELACRHRPDLVILDLHLPDAEGGEVLGRLRADPRTRHIPVVILSADATLTQVERLLAAGARRYMTKPIDVRDVLAVLDDVLPHATAAHD